MTTDVAIIGGSFAGMAAALQLLRARRSVLIIDAGRPRNRSTPRSHGFLGFDGLPPADILAIARAQLQAYTTLIRVEDEATGLAGTKDAFEITLADGTNLGARRLILATGVVDTLPDIPGLAERWGRSIAHCPYCHGYELDMGGIGVIATGPASLHQALMLPEWGTVTLLTNTAYTPDVDTRTDLKAHNITIEETPIAAIEDHATIRLADDRALPFAGLFTAPVSAPPPIAATLGCRFEDIATGSQIATDTMRETSVPGVYAAGDAASFPHSVALAVAHGTFTGASVHRSLIF